MCCAGSHRYTSLVVPATGPVGCGRRFPACSGPRLRDPSAGIRGAGVRGSPRHEARVGPGPSPPARRMRGVPPVHRTLSGTGPRSAAVVALQASTYGPEPAVNFGLLHEFHHPDTILHDCPQHYRSHLQHHRTHITGSSHRPRAGGLPHRPTSPSRDLSGRRIHRPYRPSFPRRHILLFVWARVIAPPSLATRLPSVVHVTPGRQLELPLRQRAERARP